jgi:hypothetical protein
MGAGIESGGVGGCATCMVKVSRELQFGLAMACDSVVKTPRVRITITVSAISSGRVKRRGYGGVATTGLILGATMLARRRCLAVPVG